MKNKIKELRLEQVYILGRLLGVPTEELFLRDLDLLQDKINELVKEINKLKK